MVCSTFCQFFSLFFAKLHISIFQMREMTPFSMMLLHLDLSEAPKCVDMPLIAGLLIAHSYQIQIGDDIWPKLWKFFHELVTVGDVTALKEIAISVRQLVSLLFENNFINPGLVL